MASWWTVVLILQIGALWEYTGATSCTAVTKNTCTPTLQVTGTCTNSVCDCKSGFVSTRTGCSSVVKPKIGVHPETTTGFESKSIGSGEVFNGKTIQLVCSPDYGNGYFVWYKDGTPVDGKKDSVLILTAAMTGTAGSYKCQVKFPTSDFETSFSDAVTITVIDTSGTFLIRPKVVGMPARAFSGASLPLECVNIPSGVTLTYVWNRGVAPITGASQQTLTGETKPASATAYTCSYTLTGATPPAASDDVTSPANDATAIAGVYLSSVDPSSITADGPKYDLPPTTFAEVGKQFKIYCAINDTDLIVPSSAITYAWKRGADPITETSNTLTIATPSESDEGSYTCTATVSSNPYTSKPVQINIETKVIDSVTVVATPSKHVIGGYVILDCQVTTADLRLVTYSWTRDSKTLSGVTDRTLQINDLKTSDNVAYECTATVGLDTGTDSETLAAADLTLATPDVTSNIGGGVYGLGNKYTLTCGEDYSIPGLTYRWYEGDNEVIGQTSKTYEITVKAGTTAYKCDIKLGTTTSQKSATALSVVSKQLLAVYINVGTVPVPGAYKPVTGTSVTLTCVVTTAAGASGTVNYSWTKGTTATGSGTSTLTITAGTDDGTYKCKATLGSENPESPDVIVTSLANVDKPEIETTADTYGGTSKSYSEGANYVLTCKTASYTPDLKFVWKRGVVIVGNSRVYQITNAQKGTAGDSGSYVCSAQSGTLTPVLSDDLTVTIGDKGKPCLYVDDCKGDQFDDVCASSRCVCATGYSPQGNTCSGQGIVTISMLLLVLCGLIKLIL